MNIQVFGTKKSFDTKKAQRYFKERRVKLDVYKRQVQHLVHGGAARLRQAAARVGGERFQVAPRPLGVQHAQGERRLARQMCIRDRGGEYANLWSRQTGAYLEEE